MRGILICEDINAKLPGGWPFKDIAQKSSLSVREGITHAMQIKREKILEDKSYNAYVIQQGLLEQYCTMHAIWEADISYFTREHAFMYIDWVARQKKLTNRTLNNYVIILKSLFMVLYDRGNITKNPFSKYPILPVEERYRREFNDYERKVVAAWVKEHDPLLFLSLIHI